MTKAFLYSLNVLFLLIMSKFFATGVSIEQYATDRIDHHKPFKVTLTFKTDDIKGFAKFQHSFPSGVLVDAIETQGATATYEDGKFLLIWMTLPDTNQFEVTYRVSVEDETLDQLELGGRFTYMVENERMTYDTPVRMVALGIDPNENVVVPDPVVSINRSYSENLDGSYNVKVSVTKQNVTGFAKVQEYVPANAQITEIEAQGAVFSVVDNKAKFVWLELPVPQHFTVEYQIDLSQTNNASIDDITGEFSFVHEGTTQKVEIGEESQESQESQESLENLESLESLESEVSQESQESQENLVSEESQESVESVEVVEAVAVIETVEVVESNESVESQENLENLENLESEESLESLESLEIEETIVEESVSASTEETTPPVIPEPQSGVFYRVQIAAGHNVVEKDHFEKKFGFVAPYYVEDHEGWTKYTTGEFGSYKDARNERVQLRENTTLPGPFVVAYNSGSRITVQEALMITGQKWLK